jgi:hypothetical protein
MDPKRVVIERYDQTDSYQARIYWVGFADASDRTHVEAPSFAACMAQVAEVVSLRKEKDGGSVPTPNAG